MSEETVYRPLVDKFFESDLTTAIHVLESMPDEAAAAVVQTLPAPLAVRALKTLQISYALLLERVDDDGLARVGPLLDPLFTATLLMHLSPEARSRITAYLPGKVKDEVRDLLEYPEDSIGRIMTTDFLSFR